MERSKKYFWVVMLIGAMVGFFGAKCYAEDFSVPTKVLEYVNDCDKVDRKLFVVCWNHDLDAPLAGWSIINKDLKDKVNISKRPSFYKDKEVMSMGPNDYGLPFHRGHTFANDEDNDYSTESLKNTYNMLNITPMYGNINTGIWRKIEEKGDFLATNYNVLAITLVHYNDSKPGQFPGTKLDYARIPDSFTRIYFIKETGEEECYTVKNIIEKIQDDTLENHQVDCSKLKVINQKGVM